MAISNINTIINDDIHKVWDIVFAVDKYSEWRSDLSKTEIINDKQFIEYTKDGYATIFSITAVEPYKRWEFDMKNSNMTGHWIGIFTAKGNETPDSLFLCVPHVSHSAFVPLPFEVFLRFPVNSFQSGRSYGLLFGDFLIPH